MRLKINMQLKKNLYSEFSGRGEVYGNELVVRKQYCFDFIQACKKLDLAILGVDGFNLHSDGSRSPNIDEIADFSSMKLCDSWAQYSIETIAATNSFISAMIEMGTSDGYVFVLCSEHFD